MNPLIEKYFEDNLNDAEKKEFDENLKMNAEFKEEFQFQKNIQAALHQKEREKTKDFLESIDPPSHKFLWWKVAGVAAVALIAISLIFFLPSYNDARLAGNYFHPLPNMISPKVRGANVPSTVNIAFEYYENESYDKAATEFLKLENTQYASVYAGISYIAVGEYEKSLEILNAGELEDATFEAYRKWYLGLAYLSKGDEKQAIQMFQQLEKGNNPVADLASKILSDLK